MKHGKAKPCKHKAAYSAQGNSLCFAKSRQANGFSYARCCEEPEVLKLLEQNGKENGNYYTVYWGNIGIMEKKMETTIVYWGYNRVNIGVI